MHLESVITLANRRVELIFRAFERSLRATGCKLPLLVIPYDDSLFELPANASWLDDTASVELYNWLAKNNAHRMMRKYVCLTRQNYLYADTDITFLREPSTALLPYGGFVINCCHWGDPAHTTTEETARILRQRSTTYQKTLFNAGQFACDRALYTMDPLREICERFSATCLRFPHHDQPALNLLVHASGVPITSLTLPPYNIESSWAGHYLDRAEPLWNDADTKPFLLHWAGRNFSGQYAVDELFLSHLTPAERAELLKSQTTRPPSFARRLRSFLRGVKTSFDQSFVSRG